MVTDDRRRRLFGLILPSGLFADFDADATGFQQCRHGGVVFQIGTCGISPRISTTAILLTEQPCDRRSVFVDESPFGADAVVPILSQCLGHLDADSVQHHVVVVLVGREQFSRAIGHFATHRDDVERGVIQFARLDRTEEVGDAQVRLHLLARIVKAALLLGAGFVFPHDEIVAVAIHAEIAVDHLGNEIPAGFCCRQLFAQQGPDALFERGIVFTVFGSILPLVAEQGGFVDVGGNVIKPDALHHLGAEKWRHENRVVRFDLGRACRDRRRIDFHLGRTFEAAFARFAAKVGVVDAGLLDLHQLVQRGETFKRVSPIEDSTVVHLAQILFDIAASQGGSTQQDRDVGKPLGVQLFQVLAHDDR